MKKLSPALYAQLLYDITVGASPKQQRTFIAHWLQLLRRQRAMRLMPRILAHLQQLEDAAHRRTRVNVIAADNRNLESLQRQLTALLGRVAIDLTVDSTVRGGLVLRVGDDEIDGSLRTRLRRLHHHLTNA